MKLGLFGVNVGLPAVVPRVRRLVNNRRLHGEIADGPLYTTPAAAEAAHYAQTASTETASTQ